MRELERQPLDFAARPRSVAVVGRGRLGRALAVALRDGGVAVAGPLGRAGAPPVDAVVLCVPDAQIPAAAAAVAGSAPLVGHTSGATSLSALAAAGGESFGLHPLQTFTAAGGSFDGAGCAIAGSSAAALAAARALATCVGMQPFEIDDSQRAAYHASASIASNFTVTLLAAAEQVAGSAGIDPEQARRLLLPLVERSVANWGERGPAGALTGPIARGDEETVSAQRAAVDDDLQPLFDALVERTRALAAEAVAA